MSHDIIEAFCAIEDICKAQKRANIPLVIPFDPTIRGMEALSEKVRCFAGIEHGVELFQTNAASDPSGEKPFTAHRAARRFAATFLVPTKAVSDTVEQLGIQRKRWSYELLLRIKHRFGVSAEAFNPQRPFMESGINRERLKRRT